MDWFTWLSKTSLDPSHVYDYALTFAYNELQEDDILYFSHEFLQSMGISTAKHRLEILKLARKEKGGSIQPILWFMFAIKKTRRFVTKKVEALICRDNSALSLVPSRSNSLRWKVSMLQRSKRLRATIHERPVMLRNENPKLDTGHKFLMLGNKSMLEIDSRSSSSTQTRSSTIETKGDAEYVGIAKEAIANYPWNSNSSSTLARSLDGEYWSGSMEESKWDSMFQNLKPT